MTSTRDPILAVNRESPVPLVSAHQLQRARATVAANVSREELLPLLEMIGIANPPAIRLERSSEAA